MTVLTSQGELTREALTDAPEGQYLDTILQTYNDFRRNVTSVLQNGSNVADNSTSGEKQLLLTHNVEVAIANPLKVPVRGVLPVQCQGVVLNTDGSPTSSTYALDMPTISWRPNPLSTDGGVLVKAAYNLNHAQPCLIRTASSVQSIPHGGSGTALTGWNTTAFSRGSVISDDGSIFTVTEAGTYSVAIKIPFSAGTYTAADVWINVGGVLVSEDYRPVAFTDLPIINETTIVQLAAGGTFTAFAYHTNAAVAARDVTTARRIAIHRLFNDSVPVGRINLLFYGG